MLIGIISDTHDQLHERAFAALEGCDRIIHAGDIVSPKILWELEGIAPVTAVCGNCDGAPLQQTLNSVVNTVFEGVRFVITHKPAHLRPELRSAALVKNPEEVLVGIHGHLHIPKLIRGDLAYPADLILSPGSATSPREDNPRTIAKINVDNGALLEVHIEDLAGNILFQ